MATRRRRRVNDGERSALGNAIARVGDAWAELSGDRRQTDEYFVSSARGETRAARGTHSRGAVPRHAARVRAPYRA